MTNPVSQKFQQLFNLFSSRNQFDDIAHLIEQANPLSYSNADLQLWILSAKSFIARKQKGDVDLAIQLREQIVTHPSVSSLLAARTWNGLGIAYEVNARWDKAHDAYEQAVVNYSQLGDDLGLSGVHINWGSLCKNSLDYPRAIFHCEAAIQILSKVEESRRKQIYIAAANNHLGLAKIGVGEFDEAIEAFRTASAIWLQLNDRWGIASVYENWGDAHFYKEDWQSAEKLYQSALQITQAVGNQRQVASLSYALGRVAFHQSTTEDTLKHYERALAVARDTNYLELQIRILIGVTNVYERNSDKQSALRFAKQALEIAEDVRATILHPNDRVQFLLSTLKAYEQIIGLLLSTSADWQQVFRYIEFSKSRVLSELLQTVSGVSESSEFEIDRELRQSLRNALQKDDRRTIYELENQLRRLQTTREAENQFLRKEPITLTELQNRLPEESLLLEFFQIDEMFWVLCITPELVEYHQLALTTAQLEKAFQSSQAGRVGSLHGLTRDKNGKLPSPWILETLYKRLILPIEHLMEEANLLIIVPHGLLHYVPFHALYQTKNGERIYLQDGEIGVLPILYAPSATILLDYCQRPVQSGRRKSLAVGFDIDDLTQAELEAEDVARITEGDALVGKEATQENLLLNARQYEQLHISCHGWFAQEHHALSGFALADGEFDLADIQGKLHLDTKMVCLSACETGRSHFSGGDELFGMIRGFLRAGSRSVVVSQWRIDEIATRMLVERFYQELSTSVDLAPIALAMVKAQAYVKYLTIEDISEWVTRNLSEKETEIVTGRLEGQGNLPFAHPYFWASFFVVGDRI